MKRKRHWIDATLIFIMMSDKLLKLIARFVGLKPAVNLVI